MFFKNKCFFGCGRIFSAVLLDFFQLFCRVFDDFGWTQDKFSFTAIYCRIFSFLVGTVRSWYTLMVLLTCML